MSFDPHDRELCSDGACIGVIGPQGRCNECGLPGPSTTRDPRFHGMNLDAADGDDATGADDASSPYADRELCSDGACIGVIGPDGRCGECGLPGASAGPGVTTAKTGGPRDPDGDAGEDAPSASVHPGDPAAAGDDFDSRELCPDGACIGVIGADGRCKECGTARASA